MSRRFKPSKYKNAAPKQQIHSAWIRDLSVGSYNCFGSFIKASAAFTAFNINPTGSQLGVVALDAEGPVTGYNVSILNAHSDLVTDFDFSPFEDGLLATCSADSTVKIWSINLNNLSGLSVLTPECATSSKQRRVETVCFHPTAECLITYTSQNNIYLWDILHNKELMHDDNIHKDKIISVSWSRGGELVATCAKDKMVRVMDPRTTEVVATAVNHKNDKDSRVMWLGDSHYILTSGFDTSRMRQIFIRDTRNFDSPVRTIEFDSSTGILLPLFDPDTNMVFVAGRGDSSIAYFEFNQNSDDYLLEGYRYNAQEQTKGACIIPKRALRVMDTEVNRVLQLTSNSVVSIPYFVPRKSYIEFHQDLFPDTRGTKTSGSASAWIEGHTGTVFSQSLNPVACREAPYFLGDGTLRVFKPGLATRRAEEQKSIDTILGNGSTGNGNGNGNSNCSGDYKKDVPEPRPRKKSLTPCSSFEEVGDLLVATPSPPMHVPMKFFPVPKPRVSNNTTTSGLRTPSQFISRMAADFSHTPNRSYSMDDSDNQNYHSNGPCSLPAYSDMSTYGHVKPCGIDTQSSGDIFNNANKNETNGHHLHNETEEESTDILSVTDFDYGNRRRQNSQNSQSSQNFQNNGNDQYENGNEKDSKDLRACGDDQHLSTSDRRKLFESRSQSVHENGSSPNANTNGASNANSNAVTSPGSRKPRISVAERLKMYQQNANGQNNGANSNHDDEPTDADDQPAQSNQNQSQSQSDTKPKMQTSSSINSNLSFGGSSTTSSSSNPNKDSEKREFCPAPIAKPERKFTPPKSEAGTSSKGGHESSPPPAQSSKANKRIDTVFGQVSKYRNFKVSPLHRKYHLENLRNISPTCPGESEVIQANPDRVAVPLNTPGGKIAVYELSKTGRQPDGVIPALVHGSKVMDFTWDPFDNTRLAVGCDDGKLWIWSIPSTGLKEQTNTPEFTIAAHGEKIYLVKFHPLAKDVLATSSYDLSIRIWDLGTQEGLFHIPCNEQIQILSFAWSTCAGGGLFSTMAKDGKIRIYEPRVSVQPKVEGQGPAGVRSGRVSWALDGQFLIVSGFEKSSERQIQMYSVNDLSRVAALPLDVSPSILVPFYDEDSSILFLYGRGDSTILAFDVTDEAPYLKQVSQHRLTGGHQGISWLKKNAVDVQNVEFARACRLTEVVIEPLSFTVPRVKSEYFQDDLFPPTKVLWEPTMSAEQWTNGSCQEARRISLKPQSMKAVGEISAGFFNKDKGSGDSSSDKAKVSKTSKGSTVSSAPTYKVTRAPQGSRIGDDLDDDGTKKQQEQLEQAIKDKLELNMALEQDTMEGVDEEEWNE